MVNARCFVSRRSTYECEPCVDNLKQVGNVGKLERNQPGMLVELEIILDAHKEADEKVGSSDTSEENQYPLANPSPWGVADPKEDGLNGSQRRCRTSWSELTYVLITSLGVGILWKKSRGGRHCERTFSES